jgi:hypothetical protein
MFSKYKPSRFVSATPPANVPPHEPEPIDGKDPEY